MTLETDSRQDQRYPLVMALAAGATFLAVLDATVANLAVTDLTRTFPRASVADLSWVVSLYAILFAAFLAPAGRLADVVGRRSLYTWGVALFTLMSLMCALAPSLPVLLAARAVQGVGAAAMIPASLAVVLVDSPPARRLASIGLWSAAAAGAAAVGPSVGGILIDAFSWRAVFLINLPLGALLLVGIRVVPRGGRRSSALPDALGTLLLAAGVGLATLGIAQGSAWGWTDPRTFGALLAGVVLGGWAIARSTRQAVPAVETRLWRIRSFAVANVVSLFYGAALYAWLLEGVLFLVDVWHYSPLRAGLAMSPGALLSAAVAVLVGRFGAGRDVRVPVVAGSVAIVLAGGWLLAELTATPQFLVLFLPAGLLAGLGMGAVSTGVSSAAALSVRPEQFAGATGLNMAARQFGGALGIAALAAILPAATSSAAEPYLRVVGFCCLSAGLAAVAGLGLSLPRPAREPAARSETPVEVSR
jgi:EmrB/QacA subfamily drug resistance transporter